MERKPNLLLVVLDDLWPYHYRQHHRRSPFTGENPSNVAYNPNGSNLYVHAPWLDALSARGVVFDNAYAQPVCGADRASLFTGQYTHRHGIGAVPQLGQTVESLNDTPAFSHTLLTERLRSVGYRCGAIGKYHLHRYDPGEPLARQFRHAHEVAGFDWSAITFHNLAAAPGPRPAGPGGQNWRGDNYNYYRYKNGRLTTHQSPGDGPGDHRAEDFSIRVQTDDAIEFIQRVGSRPWFCYLAYNAPHNPFDRVVDPALRRTPEYLDPGDPTGTSWANYQQQLEAIDVSLQRLQDSMPPRIWARTLVVFTADNGSLDAVLSSAARPVNKGGHGKDVGPVVEALLADSASRLKNSPFEGGLRVPLVIGGEGVRGGRVSNALFHTTDLYATLAAVAEAPFDGIDGLDQGPVLRGEVREVRSELLCMRYGPNGDHLQATDFRDLAYTKRLAGFGRDGRYKLIQRLGQPTRLYQLEDEQGGVVDPWELGPDLWNDPEYAGIRKAMEAGLAQALGAPGSKLSAVP